MFSDFNLLIVFSGESINCLINSVGRIYYNLIIRIDYLFGKRN